VQFDHNIMKSRLITIFIILLIASGSAVAQKTEITISLSEQFFDALIDAIYQNSPPPEFQLSQNSNDRTKTKLVNSFAEPTKDCPGSITLLRENKSMRTAVRFREGKIYAPVAFTGNHSAPFVGCLDFSGYAESNIELQFDRNAQKLYGRIKVNNVNLDGTAGLGGGLIARMVQSSIDKKMNPIEIISLDKLSFPFTLPNSANLKMRATGIRHEVAGTSLNIIISYEFVKD
jgi:hypothetical protein